jgi:hypothetical protein
VVIIPHSQRAPHMASDNRFYKRFNFESVPMQEYEVRDVSRRMDSPELDISVEITKSKQSTGFLFWQSGFSLTFEFEVFVGNSSEVPAENCFFACFWDRRLTIERRRKKKNQTIYVPLLNEIRFDGYVVPVYSVSIHWRPMERPLIWPGIRHFLTKMPIQLVNPSGPYHFFWEAQAPYMERKRGGFVLNVGEKGPGLSRLDADWRRTSRNVWPRYVIFCLIVLVFARMVASKPTEQQSNMKTIAIISQKGGAGKTTVAVHLAVAAENRGMNTALFDFDPQASTAS